METLKKASKLLEAGKLNELKDLLEKSRETSKIKQQEIEQLRRKMREIMLQIKQLRLEIAADK